MKINRGEALPKTNQREEQLCQTTLASGRVTCLPQVDPADLLKKMVALEGGSGEFWRRNRNV
jgi:hypothetical protein